MILVADDDGDLREMLCDVLTAEGFEVAAARHGAEAMAMLRANPSGICLVLLDVMMPIMSGVEFVERYRHDPHLKTVPVVIMSARWETTELFEGMDFLQKPMRLADILAIVRRHCRATHA